MIEQRILIYAPFLAVAAVLGALIGAIGLQLGFDVSFVMFVILGGVIIGLVWFLIVVSHKLSLQTVQTLGARMAGERFLALLKSFPGGYGIFSAQGLLRDVSGLTAMLDIPKVTHFEDIAMGVEEAGSLVTAFHTLQEKGDHFTLSIQGKNGRSFQVTGRRLRVGKAGAQILDVLWFYDSFGAPRNIQQTKALANPLAASQNAGTGRVFDSLPFPVWTRDAEQRLVMCNHAYAEVLNASCDDVVVRQLELISHTARGGTGKMLAALAVKNAKAQSERRHLIVGGQRKLFEVTEMPLAIAAPDLAIIGFAVDVTGEEAKEVELSRHTATHRDVMEHLGSAIAIFGADMRLEFYNRPYQMLWGFSELFLDGKPSLSDVIDDLRARRRAPEQADFQRYKKDMMNLFTSLLEPSEDLLLLPDGTTLRVLVAPHPLGGIMFVQEDVTDKLALEASYNTMLAVQRETLDNLAEGIAVFGQDGKLKLFNPSFSTIWKLPNDYLKTEPHISDLLDRMKSLFNFGDHWDGFKEEMVGYTLDRAMHKGRLERADESVIEYITVPLPDGEVLNSFLDVSDSVRIEQALRATNKALATADRLKSEFVANVSYQLRTPLDTIMGFAEILTNQYFGALNERQLDYTRTIMDASRRLLLLINDVLDLATIEAGRMTLMRHAVPVIDVLSAAKNMTAEWARGQGLDILIDCQADVGDFEVDEQRIKQVLFNLLSNAIKYTPAGGAITLEARRKGAWIAIAVVDTGIGIPESDHVRVFGRFERSNANARQNGAGLGLSLVKSFIELHGGRVEIQSAPQKGTRITCHLPQRAPESLPDNGDVLA